MPRQPDKKPRWKHAYDEASGGYRVSNTYGFLRVTRSNKQYSCSRGKYCEADEDHQILKRTYYVSLVRGWKSQVSRATGEVVGYREGVAVEGRTTSEVAKMRVYRFHIVCVTPWLQWVADQQAEAPRGRGRVYTDEDNKARRKLIDRRKYLFRKIVLEENLVKVATLFQEIEVLHQQLGNRFNLTGSPNAPEIQRKAIALVCKGRTGEGYQYCSPDGEGRCIHCGRGLNPQDIHL